MYSSVMVKATNFTNKNLHFSPGGTFLFYPFDYFIYSFTTCITRDIQVWIRELPKSYPIIHIINVFFFFSNSYVMIYQLILIWSDVNIRFFKNGFSIFYEIIFKYVDIILALESSTG